MTTYTKITDYAAKDSLLTGNPSKIVKGSEIGADFDAVATADASNVKGPTSAVTDNAVARWDTTTGRIAQGSTVIIDDAGAVSGVTTLTTTGNVGVGTASPETTLTINKNDANGIVVRSADTNGSTLDYGVATTSGYTYLASSRRGTGTYQPLTFWTSGLERVRIDSSGNVGVGVTPYASVGGNGNDLQIGNPLVDAGAGLTIGSTATGDVQFSDAASGVGQYAGLLRYSHANDSMQFYTNSTERLRIDSSGNGGWGVTPSAWGDSANGTRAIQLNAGSVWNYRTTSLNFSQNTFIDAAQLHTYINTAAASSYAQAGGAHIWYTAPSGTAGTTFTFTERLRIDSSGNVIVTSTGGLGYGTGSGGSVTQATSRTTGVTLSKTNGAITLFTAAGSTTATSFTVTNTTVAATDTIVLSVKSGTNKYMAFVTAVAAGSFEITFLTTGGVASDAPVINFSVIKAVTA